MASASRGSASTSDKHHEDALVPVPVPSSPRRLRSASKRPWVPAESGKGASNHGVAVSGAVASDGDPLESKMAKLGSMTAEGSGMGGHGQSEAVTSSAAVASSSAAASCAGLTAVQVEQEAEVARIEAVTGMISASVSDLESDDAEVVDRAIESFVGVCHGSEASVKAKVAKAMKGSMRRLFSHNPTCAMSIVVACEMTELDLGDNSIGDEGGKAIGEGLAGSQLTTLNLYGNSIGAEGGMAIGAGLAGSQLTALNLQGNHIGAEGAKGIGAGLAGSQLTRLNLDSNNIGAEGGKAIGAGLAGSQLLSIDLSWNEIGAE